jgi:hypothetical protein
LFLIERLAAHRSQRGQVDDRAIAANRDRDIFAIAGEVERILRR